MRRDLSISPVQGHDKCTEKKEKFNEEIEQLNVIPAEQSEEPESGRKLSSGHPLSATSMADRSRV
jgi:hypothetical protein